MGRIIDRRRVMGKVEITPPDYSKMYFTIESEADSNTITIQNENCDILPTFYYSLDDGTTWSSVTMTKGGTQSIATLGTGEKVLFKSTNNSLASGNNNYHKLSSSKNFKIYGNIMSLLNGDNFEQSSEFANGSSYNLNRLFWGATTVTDASNLILPSLTATSNCYKEMFYGCTSLTSAPTLPATTLAGNCYNAMFKGCSSLITAPELSATTLGSYCYYEMFKNCSSLTTAPNLPATIISYQGYQKMFENCTSLVVPPVISATELTNGGCAYMFKGCTALASAPVLHATQLQQSCYMFMFQNCTSLTTAPELLATTSKKECYGSMFNGCTSLNYIKCLLTDVSSENCVTDWTNNVAASGTFVKSSSMSSWPTGTSGIPSGWTVVDYTP